MMCPWLMYRHKPKQRLKLKQRPKPRWKPKPKLKRKHKQMLPNKYNSKVEKQCKMFRLELNKLTLQQWPRFKPKHKPKPKLKLKPNNKYKFNNKFKYSNPPERLMFKLQILPTLTKPQQQQQPQSCFYKQKNHLKK